MKCKECNVKLNRHGSNHKSDCSTGIRTAQALETIKDELREKHREEGMQGPEFRHPGESK